MKKKKKKRKKNIVGKGENADNQHFLLFPQCFQKALSPGASKVVSAWEKGNRIRFVL